MAGVPDERPRREGGRRFVALPVRSSRRRSSGVLVLAVLAVILLAVAFHSSREAVNGDGSMFARAAYVPQPGRTAEWTGNPGATLSDDEIGKLAANTGIE